MLNLKQEKKKKKEEQDFHILQEQKEELTQGILTFIYKASDLTVPQALDTGYDKALKWKEKKSHAICFPQRFQILIGDLTSQQVSPSKESGKEEGPLTCAQGPKR